jgi:DNA-binding transcriptional regulator YhcF (GntR family)
MFELDAIAIDRSLPVPVGKQLYGLLSYVLAFGDIPQGTRLQSVRDLAKELGIAPMTVSEVYKKLRENGLIEVRKGLGAFTVHERHVSTASSGPSSPLNADIEALIGKAERLGITAMSLASMISVQARVQRSKAGLKIMFVGTFERAARKHVENIRPVLSLNDTIDHATIHELETLPVVRAKCAQADLVLTILHRAKEVEAMLRETPVLGLRFLPSEKTRLALATLDPRVRIVAVARLEQYVSIMRPSIKEFAPHVSKIEVIWSQAEDLDDALIRADVVIYASGAEHISHRVASGVECFEYRYAPDPASLEAVLVPRLIELRNKKSSTRFVGIDAKNSAPAQHLTPTRKTRQELKNEKAV